MNQFIENVWRVHNKTAPNVEVVMSEHEWEFLRTLLETDWPKEA